MIPVSEPFFDQHEEELVLDCVRTGWVSSEGKYVRELEALCADYAGVSHGVAVSNGTTALKVAVEALQLPKGSEVILPSFTIISCVLAVIEAGLHPVLAECTEDTWCLDVDDVRSRITDRTSAIMVVHIYGHAVDMDPLMALAKVHGLAVIEDAAEAHGTTYNGRQCGSFGDVAILSFYANKLVTTGEGGMVLTDRDDVAGRARSLRNLCFQPDKRFYHTELGHNFRMGNIQAALGVAQMAKLERFISRKREMATRYRDRLSELPLQLPVEKPGVGNIYWMYGVVLDESVPMSYSDVAAALRDRGIQTRPMFYGLHLQPALHKLGLFEDDSFPITERLGERGFYIPSGQGITDQQIDTVISAIREVLN
jgi:perosamine synthetase